ncbi:MULTISPECIES: FkbM family methyltransferase [unclassified Cyanobium]|uniref:FkbM family methyltransferase n=1 Tax=unclassified Cyanobium TaxID=2627006 RepID=UPI0020CD24B0|nr:MULTISPECIES: FkbM family methyltransferase [unclassified Cyanobium]MCP9860379.1 FkbM family methyltransferase [Cyanobium sp. Cruz-8H5]MCP9867689.1 FkbM family methyltransferase [Cyanobium sp. Cruz-8D1]
MTNPSTTNAQELTREAFQLELEQADARWKQRKIELDSLVSRLPLLLFGFGGKGQTLAHHIQKHIQRELVIFDTSAHKRELAQSQGFKVLDMLTPDVLSQFAVVLGACQAQLEQKQVAGKNYIYYQEAACLFAAPHLENLALDFQNYVIPHADELFEVLRGLSPQSRESMLAVLVFRLSLDPSALKSSRQPDKNMWLDIPTKWRRRSYDTFLDVGAFDGDTLSMFQDTFSCQRGIAVEANTSLFADILKIGEKFPKGIDILPIAAWSKRTQLNFEEVRFGMIKVTEDEQGSLKAAPIDDFVSEQIDVLKMDIEGAEAKALEGCTELLNTWKPDLAIAAYHRPEDFVALYAQLKKYGFYRREYQWHFVHYSDCLDDSIFYVIRSAPMDSK